MAMIQDIQTKIASEQFELSKHACFVHEIVLLDCKFMNIARKAGRN
jgi:hypothetical protein